MHRSSPGIFLHVSFALQVVGIGLNAGISTIIEGRLQPSMRYLRGVIVAPFVKMGLVAVPCSSVASGAVRDFEVAATQVSILHNLAITDKELKARKLGAWRCRRLRLTSGKLVTDAFLISHRNLADSPHAICFHAL